MKIDIEDIKKRMDEIPFGNSYYQNVNFHTKESKERAYRHALLQIDKFLVGLQESYFRRQEIEIEIEKAQDELKKSKSWFRKLFCSKHDVKLKELDVTRKQCRLDHERKVIKDAEIEIMTHYNQIKDMPIITREEFEKSENQYWHTRLTNDAKTEHLLAGTIEKGTAQSLKQIGVELFRNPQTNQLSWNVPEDSKLEQEIKLSLAEKPIIGEKP